MAVEGKVAQFIGIWLGLWRRIGRSWKGNINSSVG